MKTTEWVLIGDRLPNHESIVDIWTVGGYRVTDCMFIDNSRYDYDETTGLHFSVGDTDRPIDIGKVTHWMPLPEPPTH